MFLAVVCCFAVAVVGVWAAHDFTWSSPRKHQATVASPKPSKPPQRRPHVVAPRVPHRPHAVAPRHIAPHAPSPSHLTLVAARGPSWVSVRAGSPTGRTLFEGLLEPRRRVTLPGRRFVARVQGGSNLDVVLGARRVNLAPYEMREVLITPGGVRLLAASAPVRIVAS
jgi:hypothetical protein